MSVDRKRRIGAENVVSKSLSPMLFLFHFLLLYCSVHIEPLKEENVSVFHNKDFGFKIACLHNDVQNRNWCD